MKYFVLSVFTASLCFGNFCPLRALHAQAAEMPVASHQHMVHAMAVEHCDDGNATMITSVSCCMGDQCFLDEYITDQKSFSFGKQAVEPVAFAGIIPAGILMVTPTSFPAQVTQEGRSAPPLEHITTIVLRT